MLHALILADLEAEGHRTGKEQAFSYELIDLEGIDHESLSQLKTAGARQVDTVFQWIQSVIVEAQANGVLAVPPPILSRVFQELNAGIMEYHRTLALTEVPFPLPYKAATHVVLMFHWILTPLIASTWSEYVWSAACISFLQVFMLWSLNAIAQELENPFGKDLNDLDTYGVHCELNERLIFLMGICNRNSPKLSPTANLRLTDPKKNFRSHSFDSLWSESGSSSPSSPCREKTADVDDALPHLAGEVQCTFDSTCVNNGCPPAEHGTFQSSTYNPCDVSDLESAVALESQVVHDKPHEALRVEVFNFVAPWKTYELCSGSHNDNVLRHTAAHSSPVDSISDKLDLDALSRLSSQQAPLDPTPCGQHEKRRSRSSQR